MSPLFGVVWTAMFVFGLILGLPGAVLGLPEVVARFALSLVDRGTLISSLFFGLLAGSAVSGPIVDRLGRRHVLAASALFLAACLYAFTLVSSIPLAIGVLAATGVASAGLNTASNALVSELFPGSRARHMNLISVAVGLGGLTLAIGTALSGGRAPWQVIVLGSAAIAVCVAAAALVTRDARADAVVRSRGPLLPAALREPTFAVLGVLLMLSAANEASMAGWTSAYLVDAGASPSTATWVLAGHWVGLIAGRSVFGRRVEQHKARAIGRAALAAAVLLAVMVVARAMPVMVVIPMAVGVAISIVTPTSLALAGDRYPASAGTVFGVLMTLAQAGAMIAPAAIGFIGARAGIRAGLTLLIVGSLGIVLIARRLARQ